MGYFKFKIGVIFYIPNDRLNNQLGVLRYDPAKGIFLKKSAYKSSNEVEIEISTKTTICCESSDNSLFILHEVISYNNRENEYHFKYAIENEYYTDKDNITKTIIQPDKLAFTQIKLSLHDINDLIGPIYYPRIDNENKLIKINTENFKESFKIGKDTIIVESLPLGGYKNYKFKLKQTVNIYYKSSRKLQLNLMGNKINEIKALLYYLLRKRVNFESIQLVINNTVTNEEYYQNLYISNLTFLEIDKKIINQDPIILPNKLDLHIIINSWFNLMSNKYFKQLINLKLLNISYPKVPFTFHYIQIVWALEAFFRYKCGCVNYLKASKTCCNLIKNNLHIKFYRQHSKDKIKRKQCPAIEFMVYQLICSLPSGLKKLLFNKISLKKFSIEVGERRHAVSHRFETHDDQKVANKLADLKDMLHIILDYYILKELEFTEAKIIEILVENAKDANDMYLRKSN